MSSPAIEQERILNNPTVAEMPHFADVVIIGGGMVGPAASWALQKEMPGIQTVVLEQEENLSAGASKASIENYRTCWPTESLAAQMARSAEIYRNADTYLGDGAREALKLKERGYLYCGFTPQQAETLKKEVEELHQMGLGHVEFLNESEVRHRYPWLGPRVVAAKADPIAGWLDSNALSYQYAKMGKNAKFLLEMKHSRIIVEGDRVVGVATEKGVIATERVIIAAGAGSREIGQTAGIDIPIVLRPRQSFVTPYRDHSIPDNAPFIIGNNPWAYMRPEGPGGIFGWEYQWKNRIDRTNGSSDYLESPVALNLVKDGRFPSMTLNALGHQFGDIFTSNHYMQGLKHQAGYYVYRGPSNTYTQDGTPYVSERALIDAWPGIDGLYVSVAHVGHGVMASAASGEIIAAHVLGQPQKNPAFYDFGVNVHWVKNDGGGL